MTTEAQLAEIIAAGESDRVEFKESLSGNAKEGIRQAICAFANDLPRSGKAGTVVVGVRDDGSLAGLEVTDRMLIRKSTYGEDDS